MFLVNVNDSVLVKCSSKNIEVGFIAIDETLNDFFSVFFGKRKYGKTTGNENGNAWNLPSVLRTRYAYELLADEDAEKALTCKREFEKAVKKYPHPKEAAAERELMDYAEELFKIRKMQDN